MAGTTRGARSAYGHDDGRKRKKRPWLLWLLGLLALLLLALALIALLGGDDKKDKADKASQSSGQSADKAASGGGAAAGGTLTAGGASLLPPPSDLSDRVGDSAEGKGVTVQAVAGQQGFWVGTSKKERVYVEYGAKAGGTEKGAAFKPKVGQKVNLTGPIRPAPEQPGRTLKVSVADEKLIKQQGAFINADRVEAAGS
jgi:hypothetical protein